MGVHARLITAASPALPSGAAMGTASQFSRVRELVDRIRTAYHFRKSHNAWAAARFCPMNLGYYLRFPEEVPVTEKGPCRALLPLDAVQGLPFCHRPVWCWQAYIRWKLEPEVSFMVYGKLATN